MSGDEYDHIVSGFYQAAAGSLGWVDALTRMQQGVSAFAVHLHGVDLAKGSVVFSHAAAGTPPECEIDYIREYHRIDPRADLVLRQEPGEWMNCWEHFDEKFVAQSPFYQSFLIPYGGRYVSGTKLLEDESMSVVLGVHRGLASERLNPEEIVFCRRLARHLTEALVLHRSHLALRSEGFLGMALLSRLRAPVALLDEERHILHANPAAMALLSDADTVVERGGRLHCRHPTDDGELLIGLLHLLRDEDADGAPAEKFFMRARAASGRAGLGLYLSALRPRQTLHAFGEQPLAMLLIHDRAARSELDPFVVAAAFDLSPAEARVAVATADGQTANEIAQHHSVAVSTVRTQLRSVFQKTGTSRQAQLVRLMADLPMTGLGIEN